MFQQHFHRDPGQFPRSRRVTLARESHSPSQPTARIEWPSNSVLQVPPRQRRSRWSTRAARRSTPHLKSVIRSSRAIRASSSTMAPVRASCKIRRPTEAHQQRRGQREDPRLVHTQSGLTSRTTREARRKAAHKNGRPRHPAPAKNSSVGADPSQRQRSPQVEQKLCHRFPENRSNETGDHAVRGKGQRNEPRQATAQGVVVGKLKHQFHVFWAGFSSSELTEESGWAVE